MALSWLLLLLFRILEVCSQPDSGQKTKASFARLVGVHLEDDTWCKKPRLGSSEYCLRVLKLGSSYPRLAVLSMCRSIAQRQTSSSHRALGLPKTVFSSTLQHSSGLKKIQCPFQYGCSMCYSQLYFSTMSSVE